MQNVEKTLEKVLQMIKDYFLNIEQFHKLKSESERTLAEIAKDK